MAKTKDVVMEDAAETPKSSKKKSGVEKEGKVKKEKKQKLEENGVDDGSVKKEKKKKRVEAEPTSPANDEDTQPPAKKAKKEKTKENDAANTQEDSDSQEVKVAVPAAAGSASDMSLDNFELSEAIKSLLRSQGIQTLFQIQAHTLPAGLTGKDVVGRARTGCGKTLGFTLPIVERLLREKAEGQFNTSRPGRQPVVIAMAPTRELAKQVHEVFNHIGQAASLVVICAYGGAPYESQESALRRGTDVVIGTPGRIKDLMARGSLKLSQLRYRVLDEVDCMLQMGFVEDVETILSAAENQGAIQTYLFSATMPKWIKSICQRFLRPGHTFVDLVGDDKQQAAATTVRHLMLPAHWQQRTQLVKDLITSYGCGGRTIVFTDTKADAGALALALQDSVGAQALHGDLAQKLREQALDGFRSGRFPVLVATDVAARGLDVTGVELVIMIDPPGDWETYIHRSGRTGRAGHTGTCITLVTRKMEYMVPIIENKGRFKFERVGAPQPSDMARVAAERAIEMMQDIKPSVIPYFRDAAAKVLEQSDSPVEALARALAQITGYKQMKARSLLTAHDDCTTLMFTSKDSIDYMGAVWGYLKKVLKIDESTCEMIKRMTLTADGKGAVFDVPTDKVDDFLTASEKCTSSGLSLSAPSQLPELKQRQDSSSGGYGNSNGYGNGYGNGGGGGYSGRNGCSPGGRGGGRGGFGGRSNGFGARNGGGGFGGRSAGRGGFGGRGRRGR